MNPPLFVTRDDSLLEELLRLAAAAGITPEVARDAGAALRCWTAAPLVLVGADLAGEMARLSPPRRAGLHLVSWGTSPDGLFRLALDASLLIDPNPAVFEIQGFTPATLTFPIAQGLFRLSIGLGTPP